MVTVKLLSVICILSVTCRWIGVWSEFIGDLVILFSAFFAVLGKDALSPGLVGLSLSFALQVVIMHCHVLSHIVDYNHVKR